MTTGLSPEQSNALDLLDRARSRLRLLTRRLTVAKAAAVDPMAIARARNDVSDQAARVVRLRAYARRTGLDLGGCE